MKLTLLLLGILLAITYAASSDTKLKLLNRRVNKELDKINQAIESVDISTIDDESQHPVRFNNLNTNNKRQSFSPTVNSYSIGFLGWAFTSETTVFGRTNVGRVWKSTDGMMTWNQVPSSQIPASAWCLDIEASHSNPNYLMFLTDTKVNYVTKDGGNTYSAINVPFVPLHVRISPDDTNHVGAVEYDEMGNFNLWVSLDFGSSWNEIASDIQDFRWCSGTRICVIGQTSTNGANGGGVNQFMTTDDFGQNFDVLFPTQAYEIIDHNKWLFVVADSQLGKGKNLWISVDNGTSIREALLPNGLILDDLDVSQILDDRDAIWLAVPNSPLKYKIPNTGNVFTADRVGYRFTKVMENAFTINNYWDFDYIHSLEATYIANFVRGQVAYADELLQTQISWDDGEHWFPLKVPDADVNGNAYQCNQTCSLNLFGRTTWLGAGDNGYFADIWSTRTAVGMVFGAGNVDEFLLTEPEDVNVFLSIDGGVNWKAIANASFVYEFGDHGGILVMVRNQVLTKTLQYSTDFGDTWTSYDFTNTPVYVVNLFTTSSHNSNFVIAAKKPNNQPAYFGLDFSNIFGQKICDPNSDYDTWELADETGQTCVLGHDTTYLRRKKTSQCDSPDHFNPISSIVNCNCTKDDYECDFDYEETLSGNCVAIGNVPAGQCYDNGTQFVSKGYRRIPGDTCINPLSDYEPTATNCKPNSSSSSGHGTTGDNVDGSGGEGVPGFVKGAIAAVVLLVILIVGVTGFMIYKKREWWRTKLPCLGRSHDGYVSTQLAMDSDEEN